MNTVSRFHGFTLLVLLRLQSWLSPVLPTGSCSYSHGLEWAVEAGHIRDRKSLVDWLEADLCYGSGRNEAIFFIEAWQCAIDDDRPRLFEIAELAAAFRATSELALENGGFFHLGARSTCPLSPCKLWQPSVRCLRRNIPGMVRFPSHLSDTDR